MHEHGMDRPAGANRLLGSGDAIPVGASNARGAAPFVLVGDHAGRAIPMSLAGLGLGQDAMDSHIAWDIGVHGLGKRLSRTLDAPFVHQRYSRLVIDCNRAPGRSDSIPESSGGVPIPGNVDIAPWDRAARIAEVYAPYQGRIAGLLDQRRRVGRRTVLVSLHSFTPSLQGHARPWKVGVLHRDDSSLSHRMLALLKAELGDEAGDNQPYAMDDADNTVPLHALPRGLDYLELEVRQDLIGGPAGQAAIGAFIAGLLGRAWAN
jgi:predicted N-formylglutamate amidohydrolase